jgi:hypothetical protein
MGPGLVAHMMFEFGPGSNDSNQTLYQAFLGSSFFCKEKVSCYRQYMLKQQKS